MGAPSGNSDGSKLRWWQLALITFVFTSAGPFGMESSVRAAGPLLTIFLIFAVPLFHVLPMIVIVTELSSWMPTNHGSVLWTARAFGPIVGFVSAMLQMFISMVDIAVYPVLFVNYLTSQFWPDVSDGWRFGIAVVVIFVGSIPSFLKVESMGIVSGVLMVLICIPFVIGVAAGAGGVNGAAISVIPSTVDVATSWSTGIWMYTGFMALGALGAEVEHHSVFLVGCGAAALLDICMYIFPLLVALQVQGTWKDGFLVRAFDHILPGLGIGVSLAGSLSGFGLYSSSMVCFSRSIWGIADRGWLPKIFARTSARTGAPYVACVLLLITSTILAQFDFDFLVALLLVISTCNFCLFYVGFLVLRYREGEKYRPFRIPGGKFGAWALVSPIIVVYFTVFVATVVSNWLLDLILCLMISILLGIYWFVVRGSESVTGPLTFHDVPDPRVLTELRAAEGLMEGHPPRSVDDDEDSSRLMMVEMTATTTTTTTVRCGYDVLDSDCSSVGQEGERVPLEKSLSTAATRPLQAAPSTSSPASVRHPQQSIGDDRSSGHNGERGSELRRRTSSSSSRVASPTTAGATPHSSIEYRGGVEGEEDEEEKHKARREDQQLATMEERMVLQMARDVEHHHHQHHQHQHQLQHHHHHHHHHPEQEDCRKHCNVEEEPLP